MSHIAARNIRVEFPLFKGAARNLKQTLLSTLIGGDLAGGAAGRGTAVRALDDVSFTMQAGDRVGLVGHNGSGKTTLLRVLAGAYEPLGGSLEVRGRVASLLDITLGIDDSATGYENIFMRGVMMGMTAREISRKMPEIADFTELGAFLHMPLYTYSSGMKMRLAFAVSTSVEADIVLMDEWLGIGDRAFRDKADRRLSQMIDGSAILVVASHNPALLKRLCNRSLRLEHGRVAETVNPRDGGGGPDPL